MKNRTEKNRNSENGVRLSGNIDITVPVSKNIFNRVCLALLAFIGVIGTVFSFLTQFHTSINRSSALFYSLLFYAVFTAIFAPYGKIRFMGIPFTLIGAFLLYKKWDSFLEGFKIVYNNIYRDIYENLSDRFDVKKASEDSVETFAAFCIFFICLAICYTLLTQPNLLYGITFTFMLIELGLMCGKAPDMPYGIMVLIYLSAIAVLGGCGYSRRIEKDESGFTQKGNKYSARSVIRFQTSGAAAVIITVICIIIMLLTYLISTFSGYERSQKLNDLRSDIKLAVNDFSLDDLGGSFDRLAASFGFGNTKLYDHSLGERGAVHFKNKTDLVVNADGVPEDNIYLKGYTGADYDGHSWNSFNNSIYIENGDMFDDFEKNGIFPQNMLNDFYFEHYSAKLIDMNVESLYDNESCNYIPYISIPDGIITYTNDTETKLENTKTYGFGCSGQQITQKNIYDMFAFLYEDNYYTMSEYGDFVFENYLNVPDTEEIDELYNRFIKDTSLELYYDRDEYVMRYEKLSAIKKILEENAVYTLEPGTTPDGRDFVNYFLLENHKGYCVHFATAGIILARMSGIPARYADGYVMLASDFDSNTHNSDGSYTINIEDSRAHAWAEIFIDGLGWIPYDFTPSASAALNGGVPDEPAETSAAVTKEPDEKKASSDTHETSVSENSHSDSKDTKASAKSHTETKNSEPSKPMSVKLKVILILLAGILALALLIAVRYFYIQGKRKKIFEGTDEKAKVIKAYELSEKLLKYTGLERKGKQYMEFAGHIDAVMSEKGFEESFVSLTSLTLKASMSGQEITQEEANAAYDYYNRLYNFILDDSNAMKQLDIRFIKVL